MHLRDDEPTARSSIETDTKTLKLAAGKLFDPYSRALLGPHAITVNTDSGLIEDVKPDDDDFQSLNFLNESVIDLRSSTVLPGFVDVHVHFFLHPYSETSWEDQLTKESVVERTVRATVHAKKTLLAGFTAVRDLGTEGASGADIQLRKCLSGASPLIPGPRYFCSDRAIVCTGSYGPKSAIHVHQEGIQGITGAEVADGKEECTKAVRRQIGAGADWIKIYADYSVRSRMSSVSSLAPAYIPTFADDELEVMIRAAHHYGVKVAVHTSNFSTMKILHSLSADSLEHGHGLKDPLFFFGDNATTWVPTLAAYYTISPNGPQWKAGSAAFRDVMLKAPDTRRLKIACGGDTGVFAHGQNSLEMKLMYQLGAKWSDVLTWGTLGGWECVRSMRWEGEAGAARLARVGELGESPSVVGDNEVPFGAIRRGFAADIIATSADLETQFEHAVSHIDFVMKGAKMYKRGGRALV